MSHHATNWAIQQRGLKPATKIVLWHLCDRHNPDHGCFPSQRRLAVDCEMARSTVQLHLENLEAAGLIRRENSFDPATHRQRATRYVFAFEAEFSPDEGTIESVDSGAETDAENGESRDRKSVTAPAKAVTEKPEKPGPKNGESRDRKSVHNPVREPLREPARARGDAAPDGAPPRDAPPDREGAPHGDGGEDGSRTDAPDGREGRGHVSAGMARADGDEPVPKALRWRARDLVIGWVLGGYIDRMDAYRLKFGVPAKGEAPSVPGLSSLSAFRVPGWDLERDEATAFVAALPVTVRREVLGVIGWVERWIAGEDPNEPAKPFKLLEDSFRRFPQTPPRDGRIDYLRKSVERDNDQSTDEEAA